MAEQQQRKQQYLILYWILKTHLTRKISKTTKTREYMCLKSSHKSWGFRVIPLPRAKQNKTTGMREMSK